MGLLSGSKTYLCGPIEYSADGQGGIVWRNKLTEILHSMGVRVYDPMKKPEWYPEISKGNPGVYVKSVLEAHAHTKCGDCGSTDPNTWINTHNEPDRSHCRDDFHKTPKRIREAFHGVSFIEKADFRYVNDCEWLIVYLPARRTYGTIDELRAAVNAGKPIMIFSEDIIPSSWIMSMVADENNFREVFFPSMDKMVDYIRKIDNGEAKLDPLKWIFLSYFNDVPLKDRSTWVEE
jgi:hypothetical protein